MNCGYEKVLGVKIDHHIGKDRTQRLEITNPMSISDRYLSKLKE